MLNKIRAYLSSPQHTKIFSLITIVAVVLAIPITVLVVQQQQEIRQRAAELISPPSPPFPPPSSGNASLSISPPTLTKNVGETFTASINLDAGSNNISGLDITITFNKDVLELTGFQKAPALTNQLINTISNQEGTLHYAATETTSVENTGVAKLGDLTFKTKGSGTSLVYFKNSQVTALGITGSLDTKTTVGTFTVAPATPTPTLTPITSFCTACSADINRDGVANVQDLAIINTCLNQPVSNKCIDADINRDGKIDALDLACVGQKQGQACSQQAPTPTPTTLLGDADGNGTVDILDYNIWREEFLDRLQTKKADFNKDGKVDLLDFSIWRNAFNVGSPSPTPISGSNRVFLTSTAYNGNLGGLSGADAKCQERANAANLGGTWKAWLSDQQISASNRLNHSNLPYKLVNGTIIANNWPDLTDSSLLNLINITELKTTYNPWVWTGSFPDGSIRQANDDGNCRNWISDRAGGTVGDASRKDGGWSDYGASDCRYNRPLYCFEQ